MRRHRRRSGGHAIGLPPAGVAGRPDDGVGASEGGPDPTAPDPYQSWFTPGQPAGRIYAHGYHLD